MKESVGYTVTLNIAITFIIIVFAFLSAAIIYFKSNKVSNVVANSIEKYEGFNALSEDEIISQMTSLGYNSNRITCSNSIRSNKGINCSFASDTVGKGESGYCVYLCDTRNDNGYYYYIIRTNMMINIPIINNILNIPINTYTNEIYDFARSL